jgi:hydrogenase maturation protein HypF
VIRAVSGVRQTESQRQAAALGFHEAVCRMALCACMLIREEEGVNTVALSGGTFQNNLLLSGCMRLLGEAGFEVYTNNEVPCNDGGLALGQVYIASMKG